MDDDADEEELSMQKPPETGSESSMLIQQMNSVQENSSLKQEVSDGATEHTDSKYKYNEENVRKSEKLLSDIQKVMDPGVRKTGKVKFGRRGSKEEEEEWKNLTQEEKIMELASNVGSTTDRPPIDEDFESLD